MKYFAVTGNPILHSQSPTIYNALFQQHGIDASYSRLAAASAADAISMYQRLGLSGLNVTAPFKHTIMPHLAQLSADATAIGGVNTITGSEQLAGDNTDQLGVTGALRAHGVNAQGQRCLILGAGGAARAATWAMTKLQARITICNRTFAHAEILAQTMSCQSIPWSQLRTQLKACDILISTLPAGALTLSPTDFNPHCVVFDANYQTGAIAQAAAAAGCKTISGMDWLFQQALGAYHIFTGAHADQPLDTPPPKLQRPLRSPGIPNIALIGFMGSGKSAVAKHLSKSLGMRYLDSDAEIERLENRSIQDLFQHPGEPYFRHAESAALASLAEETGIVLATGGGIMLDPGNRELLHRHFLTIYLACDIDVCVTRSAGGNRPLLQSSEPHRRAKELFNARKPLYFSCADLIVNASKPISEVVKTIHAEIYHTFNH